MEDLPSPDLGAVLDDREEFDRLQREGLQKRVKALERIYIRLLSHLEALGIDPCLLDQEYLEQQIRPGISVSVWPAPDYAMEIIASFEDDTGTNDCASIPAKPN
jgi:hypothetical protein